MNPDQPDRDVGGPGTSADLSRARLSRTLRSAQRWLGEVRPRRRDLRPDLLAGLPGAISSVPDGMAASLLAGVNPAHGLYASFAGPVAGGLTASTRLMVITTTSAAALAAGSALQGVPEDERSGAMVWLTLMAGALMLLAALVGAARYTRFVSHSVMLGFLTGVAVNMVLGQLPDLLGVPAGSGPSLVKGLRAVAHLGRADLATAATGVGALALLVALARTRIAVLSSLLALALPTLVVQLAHAASVGRVSDVGRIPPGLPLPALPDLSAWSLPLVWGAASVAVIVLVQGAGVAEAAPNPGGEPARARRDFVAQGVANLAAGTFGGQPVGGSVGQTALNVTAGARSRWGSVWSGLWMLVILAVCSTLVSRVAVATLAAVLVYAGWGTLRPREVLRVARAGLIPAVGMTATFVAVLALPISQAVAIGVAASLVLQLNQEALDLRVVQLVPLARGRFREQPAPARLHPGTTVVLDVYGSLFYAGARTLQRRLPAPPTGSDAPRPTVVVLRLRGRMTLGATFLKVLTDYATRLEACGGELYLSGVDEALLERWRRRQVPDQLGGRVRIFPATPVLGEATATAVASAGTHRVSTRPAEPDRPAG